MAWHVKVSGGYARDSQEAIDNAQMHLNILSPLGWTKNAIAGLMGNESVESGYNPWRWQNDDIQPTTNSPWYNHGYGLVQFTNAGKYINDENAKAMTGYGPNFSNQAGNMNDGTAQLLFIDAYADYYKTDSYPLTYAEYKASTESGAYLAAAWLYNYERPGDPGATVAARREAGDYWLSVLNGQTPGPGPGPGPGPVVFKKSKMWMYMKKRRWF